MSWDLFWHGDPQAARLYREAGRLSARRHDEEAWAQGRYVYDALLCAAPAVMAFSRTHRPLPYDELPYSHRTAEEEERRRDEEQRQNGRDAAMDIARWAAGVVQVQRDEEEAAGDG